MQRGQESGSLRPAPQRVRVGSEETTLRGITQQTAKQSVCFYEGLWRRDPIGATPAPAERVRFVLPLQVVVPMEEEDGDSEPQYVVELYIMDTSGQEMFRPMAAKHWENASLVMMVYDVTNMQSFENLEQWVQHFQTVNPGRPLCGCVVANKTDLSERINVPVEHGQNFASAHGLEFFHASAQDNNGVTEPFHRMAQKFKNMYQQRIQEFHSV
jgi:signal recognition particle receptor subunit beta